VDDGPSDAPVPDVTEEQLEKALERVVRDIYGEKIERLLPETTEKTVSREIERLKGRLMEDVEE